jgi:hypothetical protein
MSHTQIGLAAGVSRSTVLHIARHKHPTCNRESAERILAVRPRIVRNTDRVPAVGTRRRLQALYAMGHGSTVLSARTGLSKAAIQNLLYERAQDTTAATYKAVRATYRSLAVVPGSSNRAKASARAAGWFPPAAWDDDIDSPAAMPDLGEKVARYVAIAEDATWLVERQGYTRTQAANRLGITRDHLERSLSYARQRGVAA